MNDTAGAWRFCESFANPPLGRWHLRRSDDLQLGGGVTQPACGRSWTDGWDLELVVTDETVARLVAGEALCGECVEKYQASR